MNMKPSSFAVLVFCALIAKGDLLPAIGFSAPLSRAVYLGNRQAVKYDRVITNNGHGYNRWTGHFMAPRRGLYLFSCSIMAKGDGHIHIEIVKNGRKISAIYSNKSNFDQSSQTVVLSLKRGDHVWTRQRYAGRDLYDDIGYTMFTGVLISGNV